MALGSSTQSVLSLIGTIQALIDNFPMSILALLRGKKYTSVVEFVLDVLMICGVDTDEITNYIISKIFDNDKIKKSVEWIEKVKQATSEEALLEVLNSWDPSLECKTLNVIEDTIKIAIGEVLSALISCSIYPAIPNWLMDEYNGKTDYGFMSIPINTFDLFDKLKIAPSTSTGSCFYQVDSEPVLKRLQNPSMVSNKYQKLIAEAFNDSEGKVDGVQYVFNRVPDDDKIGDLPKYIAVRGNVDTGGTTFIQSATTYYKKTRASILGPNEMYMSNDLDAFLWYVINRGQKMPQTEYNKMMWDSRLYVKKYHNNTSESLKKKKSGEIINRNSGAEWLFWLNSKKTKLDDLYYSGSTTNGNSDGSPGYYRKSKLYPIMQLEYDDRAKGNESIRVYVSSQKYYLNPKKIVSSADDLKKYTKAKKGYWYIKIYNTHIPSISENVDDITLTIGPNNNIFIDGEDTNISFNDVNGDGFTNTLTSVLTPNLPTYVFNAQYLQNIKLFSTKIVFATLIRELYKLGLFGCAAEFGLSAIFSDRSNSEKIKRIISNIISVDDISVEDCYYTFSNDDYNEQLEENELKKYNAVRLPDGRIVVGDINNYDIIDTINELEAPSTPVGHVTTTSRDVYAISEATNPDDEKYINWNTEYLMRFITSLIYVFCEQLFTPKLVLLYCINLQITGIVDFNYLDVTDRNYVINFIGRKITSLLGPLILAIKDIIVELLMDLFYKYVMPLVYQFVSLTLMEKIELWIAFIEEILNCIPTFAFNFGYYKAQISDVNYADIKQIEEQIPNNGKNC